MLLICIASSRQQAEVDYYAFNEPGADVEVRGISEVMKRAKPAKWAHT